MTELLTLFGFILMFIGGQMFVNNNTQSIEYRIDIVDKVCPFCGNHNTMIYDNEKDCCLTCKSKWDI